MDGTATRPRAAATAFVESAWLAALIATPLLFSAGTDRAFEEPKVLLLRSLAGMLVAGLAVQGATSIRAVIRPQDSSLWRVAVVAPLLLMVVAYALSTAFSVNVHVSLWGAYRRSQGFYSWLSYVAVFIAILAVANRRGVDRLVTIAILSSLVPAAYGILQHYGADPFRWDPLGDRIGRIASTAGNPIFLGAFLIMVVPLTLARMLSHTMAARAQHPARARHRWLAVLYALQAALQLLGILYSRSMGPLVSLGVGLTLFGLVSTFRYRRRAVFVSIIATVAAGLVFLFLFNLPSTPLGRLHEVKYVGDLARIARVDHGTNTVRVLIWEGTVALLAASPLRALTGHGPEVMPLVFGHYYPAELIDYESAGAMPDRAHNQTLDALVGIGIVGWAAQLLLFGTLFFGALRGLGMVTTPAQRRFFIAVVVVGAGAGVFIPRLLAGTFVFSALGLGAGIAVAILGFVVISAFTRWHETPLPVSTEQLLLLGILAGLFAHFVEIQVGISVVASELCFFAWAALIVILGTDRVTAADDGRGAVDEIVQGGSIVGVGLIVLTFSFYLSGMDLAGEGWVASSLLATLWLGGGLVILGETARSGGPARRVALYVASSAGPWMLFATACAWWNAVRHTGAATIGDAVSLGNHMAGTHVMLYGGVLGCIALPAIFALWRSRAEGKTAIAVRRGAWMYAIGFVGAIALAWVNLSGARADSLRGLAAKYEEHGGFAAAAALHEAASRLQPAEEIHAIAAGRAHMEQARSAIDAGEAMPEAELSASEVVLQRTATLNPLSTAAALNLARLHRLWAIAPSDPSAAVRHVEDAERSYEAVLHRQPYDSNVLNEWATMYSDQGELTKAMDILGRSLALHPRWATYCLRAGLYLHQGKFESALHDYDSALRLKVNPVEAVSGRAAALAALGRIDEAVVAGRLAAELAPHDPTAHSNLALLYRQAGQRQAAIAAARVALQLSAPAEQPAVQRLVAQLTAESAPTAQ